MTLINLIFGRRLATDEGESQKIGTVSDVPAMGLDGLAGIAQIVPITGLVLVLLALPYFSYLQTIPAYPNGGGSYVVASQNLGGRPELLSAAAPTDCRRPCCARAATGSWSSPCPGGSIPTRMAPMRIRRRFRNAAGRGLMRAGGLLREW